MSDWTSNNWSKSKTEIQARQQMARLITIGHHRSAEKGRIGGLTFEETQAKIEEWKATAPLIPCKLPGVKTITEDGCINYRRGKRENVSDDEFVVLLDICNECRGERRPRGDRPKKNRRGSEVNQVRRKVMNCLSPGEIAQRLGTSAWRVIEWCRQGRIKYQDLATYNSRKSVFAISREEFDRFRRNVWPRLKGPTNQRKSKA